MFLELLNTCLHLHILLPSQTKHAQLNPKTQWIYGHCLPSCTNQKPGCHPCLLLLTHPAYPISNKGDRIYALGLSYIWFLPFLLPPGDYCKLLPLLSVPCLLLYCLSLLSHSIPFKDGTSSMKSSLSLHPQTLPITIIIPSSKPVTSFCLVAHILGCLI